MSRSSWTEKDGLDTTRLTSNKEHSSRLKGARAQPEVKSEEVSESWENTNNDRIENEEPGERKTGMQEWKEMNCYFNHQTKMINNSKIVLNN